ncbi:GNAT family N-acetyltransferase [Luteococcus peritonei]|uniref:GNAT family N-acetyltransferase n=1 Tax=Luteococcus peritonei TaxID=88874 RepID=A0ABW4RWB1_9ACTN
MSVQIVPPDPGFRESLLAAWDEFDAVDGGGGNWTGCFGLSREQVSSEEGFAAMCRTRRQEATNPAEGLVPATMLWAVEDDEWLGRVSIRHELNEHLAHVGGHIGYAVRPTARRRGIASALMRAGLDHLAALGVERALVTCDEDNTGSIAVIEQAGGVLQDVVEAKRRYWVATA